MFGSTARNALDSGVCESANETLRQLASIADHERRTQEAVDFSWRADRRDYARVAPFMRWVVILRGYCERAIACHALRRERARRPQLEHDLGAVALDGEESALRSRVPAEIAQAVDQARRELETARAARVDLLRPHGGRALPRSLYVALRESGRLAHSVVAQLKRKALLRPPALAGLIAGWWVARGWAPNLIERVDQALGGVFFSQAHEHRRRLAFWIPILAAGLCAYLGSLLGRWVRRKYETATSDGKGASP